MKINTEQDYLGTWRATDDNYQADTDEGHWQSDGIVGEGLTEKDAIADYWEQRSEQ
jgi:hypothetical protein